MQTPSKSTANNGGQLIRPTGDRAREALFNIIGREIEHASVLDLYAGTGALGLEALSRSAERAVFIDNSENAVQIIRKNIALCGFSDRSIVFRRSLTKGLSFLTRHLPGISFSVVFADPPYRKGLSTQILTELAKTHLLQPEALVVIEESAVAELAPEMAGLTLADKRRYGDTRFWFYRRQSPNRNHEGKE